jgi:NADPH2:quinone reductase
MRAVVLSEFGAKPEVREIDVPEPGEGEVRVRVRAASVNGFDLAVANGYLNGMMEHRFPVVLGKDFAGVVDAVGAGVSDLSPGDRVFGVVTKAYLGDGSFAEYVTVPVAMGLARVPEQVSDTDAAALGLAGTAARAAVEAAAPAPGRTILVSGATGGVGNLAVQLAAAAGATVIATAHTDQEKAAVAALGASEVVDHTGDVADQLRVSRPGGVDAVLHLAGDPAALLPVLRDGGTFVSTLIGSPEQLPVENATVVPIFANPTPDVLDRLAADHAEQRTRVGVQRVYPLDETPTALTDFAGGTLGKLVVLID